MPQLQRQRRYGRIHWRIILKTSHALQTFKMIDSMDIGLLWLHPALKKLLYYYWPVMTLSLVCQFRLGERLFEKWFISWNVRGIRCQWPMTETHDRHYGQHVCQWSAPNIIRVESFAPLVTAFVHLEVILTFGIFYNGQFVSSCHRRPMYSFFPPPMSMHRPKLSYFKFLRLPNLKLLLSCKGLGNSPSTMTAVHTY